MAISLYDNFQLRQNNGNAVSLVTGAVKLMITTSAYVPDRAAHVFKSSVTNEVVGTNYTARGFALSSVTLALQGNGDLKFDAADITITQSAGGFSNGRTVVIYFDTGADGTSPLIGFFTNAIDFGNVAGAQPIQFAPAGILLAQRLS